jgi:hypothetical protein
MRVKHEDMKQENELKDELRAQPALDHQKPKTGTPHSIAHIRRRLDRIIPLSPTPNCRVLLPSGTADDEVFADEGGWSGCSNRRREKECHHGCGVVYEIIPQVTVIAIATASRPSATTFL